MSNRKTNEHFMREFIEHGNANVQLLGEYITRKTQIPVVCKKCGYRWDAWPDSLLRGSGCRKCANKIKLSTEDFVKRMLSVNPGIEVTGSYSTTHEQIDVRCKTCGYEWASMPSNLLRNYGCPKCNGGIKHTKEFFLERMHAEHPEVEVLEDYVNSLTPITMKCLRCGKKWKAAPNTMLNGNKSDCPACAHTQSSFLEQLLLEVCRQGFGFDRVLSRDRSIIDSELDIVILDNTKKPIYAIEPGSWTLHRDKYLQDLRKITECEEKEIRLLIIYDQDKNEEVKSTENIWSYKKSFSLASDKSLEELLKRIMAYFHFSTEINMEKLKRIAHDNSRRMSTEEFRKQLNVIDPNIILLGNYNGSMRKTQVKCKICGFRWSPTPQMLLRLKTGCPKCHKVPRKDTAYFIAELAQINPTICVLGEYINARTKIRVKCNLCGYEWSPVPDKLLHGRSCPECAKKKKSSSKSRAVKNSDTGEIFPSINSAIKQTGIHNISACCRGKIRSAGGYRWEYV